MSSPATKTTAYDSSRKGIAARVFTRLAGLGSSRAFVSVVRFVTGAPVLSSTARVAVAARSSSNAPEPRGDVQPRCGKRVLARCILPIAILCVVAFGLHIIYIIYPELVWPPALRGLFARSTPSSQRKYESVKIRLGSGAVLVDRIGHDWFGVSEEAEDLETSFRLQNTGSVPLDLGAPRTACGCSSVRASSERLEPGQSAELTVTVTTNGAPSLVTQAWLPVKTADAHVFTDIAFQLRAFGRHSIHVEPRRVEFTVVGGRPASQLRGLHVTVIPSADGAGPSQEVQRVETYIPGLTAFVDDAKVIAGAIKQNVRLQYCPSQFIAPGTYEGAASLYCDSHDSAPALTIPITVNVEPPVRAIPQTVVWKSPTGIAEVTLEGCRDCPDFDAAVLKSSLGVMASVATGADGHRRVCIRSVDPAAMDRRCVVDVSIRLASGFTYVTSIICLPQLVAGAQ